MITGHKIKNKFRQNTPKELKKIINRIGPSQLFTLPSERQQSLWRFETAQSITDQDDQHVCYWDQLLRCVQESDVECISVQGDRWTCGNVIDDFQFTRFTCLKQIYISVWGVKNIQTIAFLDCPFIQKITIQYTFITCAKPLEKTQFRQLKWLYLSKRFVQSIEVNRVKLRTQIQIQDDKFSIFSEFLVNHIGLIGKLETFFIKIHNSQLMKQSSIRQEKVQKVLFKQRLFLENQM